MKKFSQAFKYLMWHMSRKLNFDIYPLDKRNSVQSYLSHIIKVHQIDCIWDVGANTGQYANMIRKIGYKGKIISFEPIPSAWNKLIELSSKDNNWTIYDRCALGLNEEVTYLYVTDDSVSSSLLIPLDSSKVVDRVEVIVKRLEDIVSDLNEWDGNLLKIDAQGGEYDILLSAGSNINKFTYIQLEASIYPLYEGERTLFDLIDLMSGFGYDVAFIYPGVTDSSERMLQVEVFFKRR